MSGVSYASAEEFTDGVAVTESVAEEPAAEATEPVVEEPATDTTVDVPVEETTETDITITDGTEETPATIETETPAATEEDSTAVDFGDGTAYADATAGTTDDYEDSLPEPAEEQSNQVYFTRWEYSEEYATWRLQKNTSTDTDPVYYTAADGIVTLTTIYTDGTEMFKGAYLFDANGYMLTGDQLVNNQTWHFLTYEEAQATMDAEKTTALKNMLKAVNEQMQAEYQLLYNKAAAEAEAQTTETQTTEAETVETASVSDSSAFDELEAKYEKLDQIENLLCGTGTLEENNQVRWNAAEQKFEYYQADSNSWISSFNDKTLVEYESAVFCVKADGTLYTGEQTVTTEIVTANVDETSTATASEATYLFEASYTDASGNEIMGAAVTNKWVWNGTAFTYYGENGAAVTFTDKQVIEPYSGVYFCVNTQGVPYQEEVETTVKGNSGFFAFKDNYTNDSGQTIPGKMVTGKWVEYQGVSYEEATNKKKYGNYYRYYNENGQREVKKSGVYYVKNDKTLYYVFQDGYLVRGRMAKAGNDGKYYASNQNGVVYISCLVSVKRSDRTTSSGSTGKDGCDRYYFKADGSLSGCRNVWVWIGRYKRYFYFGKSNGKIDELSGFQKLTLKGQYKGWLYFDSNHNAIKSQWRAGNQRYFGSDGLMYSGVSKVGNNYYYFQKSTATAVRGKMYKDKLIQDVKNGQKCYYYAHWNGTLKQNNWLGLNGILYHFTNYTADLNKALAYNGVWGRTDSNGVWHKPGWITVNDANNQVMYLNPANGEYAKSTVMLIDGKYYRFDSNGYRVNDRTSEYSLGSGLYLEVDRVNCVMTVYTNSSKTVPIKTIRVSVGLSGTATPTGTYRLQRSARWQPLMGPSWGQYGTWVANAGRGGIYVHSVSGANANIYSLPAGEYNKLGQPASHGCIRVCVADAKWVYDNANGATIHIYDGNYTSSEAFKGPLGRKKLVPLYGSCNFDPTDPLI